MGAYHSVVLLISDVTSWIGIHVSYSDENIPVITEVNRANILAVAGDSVVGIATRYRLDGPDIESLWGRDFPHQPRPALQPTHLLFMGTGSFPEVKQTGGGVDHPPHPAPRLKKG